jgi:hypothetical protein
MIRRLLLPVVLASSLLTSGCYTVTMQIDSSYPVMVNQSKSKKGYFSHEDRVFYFLFGLVNGNPRVVDDLMRAHKTRPVRSVNVSTEADVVGVITTYVTLGLVSSRVVRVEGHEE